MVHLRTHTHGAGRAALLAAILGLTLAATPASARPDEARIVDAGASSAARSAAPTLAVDGSTTTAWRPSNRRASTWQGTIAGTGALSHLEVYAQGRRGGASQRVAVQVSADGRRFTTVRTVQLKSGRWQRIALDGRRGKAVRLRSFGAWSVWLNEVRLFMQRLTPTAPAPTTTTTPAQPAPAPTPTTTTPTTPPPMTDTDPTPQGDGTEIDTGATAHEPTGPAPTPAPSRGSFAGVVSTPIDPRFLTQVPFGDRSHWLQPWRAFLDTPPASRLRDAVGINFNVSAAEAPSVARLLAANGFHRARIEIAWGELDFTDPTKLWRADEWRTKLRALRDNGLRPLVLLNSDDGRPTAVKDETLKLTSSASAGTRTVQLDAASAAKVVPRRTGFTNGHTRADILISSISGTTATLSKPLPMSVGAGSYPAATLQVEPFSPLTKADGSPNPAGAQTLQAWLDYVQTVTSFVRTELDSTNFDVEVSNEANLNSAFWDVNRYYEPDPFPGRVAEEDILRRTVSWIKDPAHGLSGVRIGSGFSSQRPWDSAATSPVGLDALDRHDYPRYLRFPSSQLTGNRPIDALGNVSGWNIGGWRDQFAPTYDTFLPEYSLNAITTESIVRDTAPITTNIIDLKGRSTPHGRNVTNAAGAPVEFWMTEINVETAAAKALTSLSYTDEEYLRAKAALRTLTSYVNKGVTQVDFYGAGTPEWTLLGQEFWRKLAADGQYPGDTTGGPALDGIRRITSALGRDQVTVPRKLTLASIGDYAGRKQFDGDGSTARPTFYDRDALAFLPFQASDSRFVVPVYVMTRNMAKVQKPGAPSSDPTRFDLPAETYQLTIGGTNAKTAKVSATDPLTGASVPVDVVRRTDSGWLVVELPVTDTPRLLTIDDA